MPAPLTAAVPRVLSCPTLSRGQATMRAFRFRGTQYLDPAEIAIEVLGGKWKPPILDLLSAGPQRYVDLEANLGDITPPMLVRQLRQLEAAGLVARESRPRHVEYSLTRLGRSVLPIVADLRTWGAKYRAAVR